MLDPGPACEETRFPQMRTTLITLNSILFLLALLLLVRHLLLEAMHLFLIAYCFYQKMVGTSWFGTLESLSESGSV